MKKLYFLSIIIFLIYALTVYEEYGEVKKMSNRDFRSKKILVIENKIEFNVSSYIFQHTAWNLEKKIEKEALLNININKNRQPGIALKIHVDKTTSPIQICDGTECYEFIAIKNDKLIVYGKNKKKKKTFIALSVNSKLNKRLTLHKLASTSFSLYDSEFDELITLSMFDINLSKYKVKDKNSSILLPGGKNEK
ncbi:MAG TPA: hypothetical protein EYG85_11945 [Crocinitomix sp.]|nr:hypothetical protein [Crocinitomix sp.]